MGINRYKLKNRLARFQLMFKLLIVLIAATNPLRLLAQEMTQHTVSYGADLVTGGNYTGYASAGQMATYMYANGAVIATQGIILNEISDDVEFTFELSGNLTENEVLKSGSLIMKAASTALAGTPLASVSVYLLDTETGEVLYETVTDTNGFFIFPNIPYRNFHFTIRTPEVPAEPVLLTFKSNIFIKEVEINAEVGTKGLTTSVTVIPNNTCGPENPDYKIWYLDYDNDGFGTSNSTVGQCTQPVGYVLDNSDCDDTNAAINPGASDFGGVDLNCNGVVECTGISNLVFDGPTEPIDISNTITIFAGYFGNSPNSATIDWGDGNTSDAAISEGLISGVYNYSLAGVYTINLTLEDDCGIEQTFTHKYIVIYDPTSGFVTGSGTIYSPLGASVLFPNATGTASFGFVSKYDKKTVLPKGNTEFEFDAGNLHFVSNEYEWLVVAGSKAKFKGRGTINGIPGFQFMISAIDGDINEKGDPDLFRIKIWNESTGDVVYDNQMDAEIDADLTTVILEGSIKIHTPKTKSESILTSIDMDNSDGEKFIVYPNPTSGIVKIKGFQSDREYLIKVIDMTGREIKVKKNSDFELEINLTNYPVGIYNLVIQDNTGSISYPIIRK